MRPRRGKFWLWGVRDQGPDMPHFLGNRRLEQHCEASSVETPGAQGRETAEDPRQNHDKAFTFVPTLDIVQRVCASWIGSQQVYVQVLSLPPTN